MPFRQAHAVAGRAVALAVAQDKELDDLSLSQFTQLSDLVADDVYDFIRLEQVVARRISAGGTGFDNVRAAVEKAHKELNS
jgi:argininosuccinate lyase